MKCIRVTFYAPDNSPARQYDVEFTSETDSLHIRMEPGAIEVRDGNIVLAAYANIPVVVRNMDDWPGGA